MCRDIEVVEAKEGHVYLDCAEDGVCLAREADDY